jgi:hypothetical protein
VAYQSGDDPQLLSDLRTALKRWHRPTLGDAALADRLADIHRRQVSDPGLTRSNALRQMVRAALASLQASKRVREKDLQPAPPDVSLCHQSGYPKDWHNGDSGLGRTPWP